MLPAIAASMSSSDSGGTGSELYNITLGTHIDAVNINTAVIGSTVNAANTVVTGAQNGDVLIFGHGAAATATESFGDLSSLLTIDAALAQAHAQATAGDVASFMFNNDTYVFEDAVQGGGAGSTVVQLVGVAATIGSIVGGHAVLVLEGEASL